MLYEVITHDTEESSFRQLSGRDEIADLSRSILNMLRVLRKNFSELQVMQQFLTSSEERYKSLFMNTGNALVVVDEDTVIQLANQEFYNIMKIPEGVKVEGRSCVITSYSIHYTKLYEEVRVFAAKGELCAVRRREVRRPLVRSISPA